MKNFWKIFEELLKNFRGRFWKHSADALKILLVFKKFLGTFEETSMQLLKTFKNFIIKERKRKFGIILEKINIGKNLDLLKKISFRNI